MPKKKNKKKEAKRKHIVLTELQMRAMLEHKRLSVMEEVGHVESTGEGFDSSIGEPYPFTKAGHVFEKYREAFLANGLTILPVARPDLQPQVMTLFRGVGIIGYYEITDVDTGYSVVGWGIGTGSNEFWSGNSAQTRAMKQFLLNAGLASWHDPDENEQQRIKKAVYEQARELLRRMGVEQQMPAAEQIGDYFQSQFKEKKDGADSGKSDTDTTNKGKRGQKVRGRQKRHSG